MENRCFEEVYQLYQPLLYGTLKKLSVYKNQEDILQEARLALWEAYMRYDPARGSFAAYADRYVKGKVMRYMSRQNKHQWSQPFSSFESGDQDVEVEWKDEYAERDFRRWEVSEWVTSIFPQLSPREQLVLIHHVFQDRPLQELAKREEVSIETVKTWKKRAVKKCRRLLSPDWDEEDI